VLDRAHHAFFSQRALIASIRCHRHARARLKQRLSRAGLTGGAIALSSVKISLRVTTFT
jgi:hypothetical protein